MEKTPPPTGHPSQRDLRSGQLQLKARSVGSAHSTTDTILFGLGKINCMSFKQRMASELYFVTSKTAFTIPYLELCYYRLLRAKTSPGQEAAVRHLVHSESLAMFWQHHSFRDHLLHAVEGYALARRTPDEVIPFNLDYPAKHVVKVKNPLLLFHPVKPVCEPRRTVAQKGRPMKLLPEHERSCHCKKRMQCGKCFLIAQLAGSLQWTQRLARCLGPMSTSSTTEMKTKWLCSRRSWLCPT